MLRSATPQIGSDMAVLRRTSLGMRSELLLVEIEGQRLLLGVTPHGSQTLYVLPDSQGKAPSPPASLGSSDSIDGEGAWEGEPRDARRGRTRATVIGLSLVGLLAVVAGAARLRFAHPTPAQAVHVPVQVATAPIIPELAAIPTAPPPAVVAATPEEARNVTAAAHDDVPASTPERASASDPTRGIITSSPNHRLWIDGRLAAGSKVSVGCGSHTVQVGSRGAPRTIAVACGEVVTVSQ